MIAKVSVTLKPALLDAQGKTVQHALESLGFKNLKRVRVGKLIEIEVDGSSPEVARRDAEKMCEKLLANPIIETYSVDIQH